MRPGINKLSLSCISLLLAAAPAVAQVAPPSPAAPAPEVTSKQVSDAIQRGVAIIRRNINLAAADERSQGMLALLVLAQLNAGVSLDDPNLRDALDAVAIIPNSFTYTVGLKVQVLAAARMISEDPKLYEASFNAAAKWLCDAQQQNGMWSYGMIGGCDNSNTQFALLGLHEAAKAGYKVPKEVWTRSKDHFVSEQIEGGWGYRKGEKVTGSMTTAGLASLYICGQRLNVGGPRAFANGVYPDCGKYQQYAPIAAGLKWMTRNFDVASNPNNGRTWLHYYLYGLERVGMLSGAASFGQHDWYREGAAFLISTQGGAGSWANGQDSTAFSVLFLAKGNRPVIMQKLMWRDKTGKEGRWNRNLYDLENLTIFLGNKLGKPTTWQTASLEQSLQQLRLSPILYITGHEFPLFSPAEREKLRQYINAGGTLLFDACCNSDAFRVGFRTFAKEAFPESALRKLNADHPVFNCLIDVKGQTYDLEGMDVGCRTSIFYSPHPLSCLWELQSVPESALAFKIGANIAAYATGREQLANKLDVVALPEAAKTATQPAEVPRGAVRIARLKHSAEYNADPHALVNLAGMLRDKANIDVVAKDRVIDATDEKLYDYPVLFMTGHFSFTLSDEEVAALRKYLDRGGFLVADACCGQKAFDGSFRELVARLYPDKPLRPLEANHPIYTGQVGLPMGELAYRQILSQEVKERGTNRPPLESVEVGGRAVILYSKYDFSCSLEGDNPFSCRGYIDADGQRLAINVMLYAISY